MVKYEAVSWVLSQSFTGGQDFTTMQNNNSNNNNNNATTKYNISKSKSAGNKMNNMP